MTSQLPAKPKFIIWAPSYDETSGGIIALHTLCARLNSSGWSAKIWPPYADPRPQTNFLQALLNFARKLYGNLRYSAGPDNNPLADATDVPGSIVIYPEIVAGNPLDGANVVRWILYHPGRHTRQISFGQNDLIVPYSQEFLSEFPVRKNENTLRISKLNPIYHKWNNEERQGCCLLIYKGTGRTHDGHPPDSVLVDTFSHAKKAEFFNKAKYLFSYDLYSFYNTYAAVCGCIPIIIPRPGLSREQWYADERLRYGLAYGVDDIQWAIDTRHLLLAQLKRSKEEEDQHLVAFVERCSTAFLNAWTLNEPVRYAKAP